jgi:hypothetical protein
MKLYFEVYIKAREKIESKFQFLPYGPRLVIYELLNHADPTTGIVSNLSYRDLSKSLEIESAPGRVDSGTPSKQTIRNYIKSIEHHCGDYFKVISEGQSLKFFFPEVPKVFSKISENTEVNTVSNTDKSLENTDKDEGAKEKVDTDLNIEVNTPESAVKKLFINNIKTNNNNMIGEKIGNKNNQKTIPQNFYPSQEIIARAIASGHNNATDPDIIQEFIDKNTAWGSTFADFNPIYLSFLAKHAERKQQESVIANTQTRSKNNERTSLKVNSYDAALEEVRRNNQNACNPTDDEFFEASKILNAKLKHTAHLMALGGAHKDIRCFVSY